MVLALILGACGDDDGSYYGPDHRGPGQNAQDAGSYADSGGAYDAFAASDGGSHEPPPDETIPVSPFVLADSDPFSTFAADVDTASYDIFVQAIERGELPGPQTVRLEEHVNFFDYGYERPANDATEPFAVHLAAAPHPMGRPVTQLRVGIAATAERPFEKRPTNLVFMVDVTGSMDAPDKFPVVLSLLRATLDVLEPTDRVAIVAYASSPRVALPSTPVSERGRIEAVIDSLRASGSTAGGAAMELAYAEAEAGWQPGGLNHVIMCTDGDFNVGVTSEDALVAMIEEQRESGVTLTALGFGYGSNDAMMERVSNAGNGIYSVIRNHTHAGEYASEQLLRTAHHIAKDMKIQVEFNPEHVRAYRLLGYANRAIADNDFRNDAVDAGEVGAGLAVTALYEVVLAGDEIPMPDGAAPPSEGEMNETERNIDAGELVRVRVRYKQPRASTADPALEVASALMASDLETDAPQRLAAEADASFLWASGVAAFAEVLGRSPYAADGDGERIQTMLTPLASDDDRNAYLTHLSEALPLLP